MEMAIPAKCPKDLTAPDGFRWIKAALAARAHHSHPGMMP